MTANFDQNGIRVQGVSQLLGGITPSQPRSMLAPDLSMPYPLGLQYWRKSTDVSAILPSTSSGSDLGLYTGTYGTNTPKLSTGDVHSAGAVTRRARLVAPVPVEWYTQNGTVKIRVSAGMEGHIADTLATVLVEAYASGRTLAVTGAGNLISTAATSINSVTFQDYLFPLSVSTLTPGIELDLRVTLVVTDAATGTLVQASIGAIELLADIWG